MYCRTLQYHHKLSGQCWPFDPRLIEKAKHHSRSTVWIPKSLNRLKTCQKVRWIAKRPHGLSVSLAVRVKTILVHTLQRVVHSKCCLWSHFFLSRCFMNISSIVIIFVVVVINFDSSLSLGMWQFWSISHHAGNFGDQKQVWTPETGVLWSHYNQNLCTLLFSDTRYILIEKVFAFYHFFLDFGRGAHTYCLRLLTYIPGKMVLECPLSNQDLFRIGQLVGNVNKILHAVSWKPKCI